MPPTIYLLYGDDQHGIQQFLAAIVGKMGDPATAEMNTSHLDGRTDGDSQMRNAAMAMPFLAERRLVIVIHPLARLTEASAQARFIKLLEALPLSTAFVLVIEDHQRYGNWEKLKPDHWLMKWVVDNKERVLVKEFPLPQLAAMPAWITRQVDERGGHITDAAARMLSEQVGSDTLFACQEIDKLLTYLNGEGAVTEEVVEKLATPGSQADIFKLVDSLAEGDGRTALRMLKKLLEEQDPLSLFGMVVRQFRLLLQAREVLDEGGNQEAIARELHQPPFVARKLYNQAPHFTLPELENIHRRLLEVDEAAKTSAMPLELSLEILIADLSR
jgi:DNA polymerase-3 subunit delta